MCNCETTINEILSYPSDKSITLSVVLWTGEPETRLIVDRDNDKTVIESKYCPFCGERYKPE